MSFQYLFDRDRRLLFVKLNDQNQKSYLVGLRIDDLGEHGSTPRTIAVVPIDKRVNQRARRAHVVIALPERETHRLSIARINEGVHGTHAAAGTGDQIEIVSDPNNDGTTPVTRWSLANKEQPQLVVGPVQAQLPLHLLPLTSMLSNRQGSMIHPAVRDRQSGLPTSFKVMTESVREENGPLVGDRIVVGHDNKTVLPNKVTVSLSHFRAAEEAAQIIDDPEFTCKSRPNWQQASFDPEDVGQVREIDLPAMKVDAETGKKRVLDYPIGFMDRLVIEASPACEVVFVDEGGREIPFDNGLLVLVSLGDGKFGVDRNLFRTRYAERMNTPLTTAKVGHWAEGCPSLEQRIPFGEVHGSNPITEYHYATFVDALSKMGIDGDTILPLVASMSSYAVQAQAFELLTHDRFARAAAAIAARAGSPNPGTSEWLHLLGIECIARSLIDWQEAQYVDRQGDEAEMDDALIYHGPPLDGTQIRTLATDWAEQFREEPWRLIEASLFDNVYELVLNKVDADLGSISQGFAQFGLKRDEIARLVKIREQTDRLMGRRDRERRPIALSSIDEDLATEETDWDYWANWTVGAARDCRLFEDGTNDDTIRRFVERISRSNKQLPLVTETARIAAATFEEHLKTRKVTPFRPSVANENGEPNMVKEIARMFASFIDNNAAREIDAQVEKNGLSHPARKSIRQGGFADAGASFQGGDGSDPEDIFHQRPNEPILRDWQLDILDQLSQGEISSAGS